jgi:uncharacterized protein (UPF0332 family)
VNSERLAEITANLERAEKSLRAAKELLDDGYQDFAFLWLSAICH